MARRQPPSRWICPLCGRSVPPDVDSCYCGTSHAAVLAHAQRERQRKARPFPWVVFLGELVVVAFGVYWVLAPNDMPEATLPPAPVAVPAAIPRETPTVAPSSSSSLETPATLPSQAPLTRANERETVHRAEPTTASSPKLTLPAKPERTETDLEREAGEKHLEQSLARLAAVMRALSENAQQFEVVCLGRRGDPRSCARLHADMAAADESLARGLEGAEDEARHAWVSPGVVRDLRQKHGLEEESWKDLQGKVRRLTAQYQGTN
jgi:hypothetical protein